MSDFSTICHVLALINLTESRISVEFGSGITVAFVRSGERTTMHEEFYSWIKNHKVCFEIAPFNCLHNSEIKQLGFELHLYAQYDGHPMKDPANADAHNLYFGLLRIAHGAIPSIMSGCRYEVGNCDSSFRLRPETGLMEEVQLVLTIVHRENFFETVDKTEAVFMEEIKKRLIGMGVQMQVWQENSLNGANFDHSKQTIMS